MALSHIVDKNYFKLGQIYQFFKNKLTKLERIKAIINSGFDINFKLPLNSFICQNKPEYSGNTALHFLAIFYNKFQSSCIDLLIEQGADFTIKNDDGYTPLLLAFQKNTVIDLLLFAHLRKENSTNYYCKNGISHFHVICSTDHVEIVNFFLKAGIAVNECVNNNSPKYPGYTPLHFAMQHCCFQTIELLLSKGANLNSKDANGITPLHLFLQEIWKMETPKINSRIQFLEKISCINFLPDYVGLTYLHIICISDDVNLVNRVLNQSTDVNSLIKFDSPVWPGFTPLHVASNFSLQTVILLLQKGANLLAKDANGETPLDLCFYKYKCFPYKFSLDNIIQFLSIEKRHNLSQVKFTDGTYLLDVLHAMSEIKKFKRFIRHNVKNVNIQITDESPLWPGFSLLHVTILFDGHVKDLLNLNADFTKLNPEGMSPLHLALRMNRLEIIKIILDYHHKTPINPIDPNNMSHLHIACSRRHHKAIEVLLQNGANPNLATIHDLKYIPPSPCPLHTFLGYTPLHVSLNKNDYYSVNLLMSFGANPNIADAKGKTSFKMILYGFLDEFSLSNIKFLKVFEQMMKTNVKDRMTTVTSLQMFDTAKYIVKSNPLFVRIVSEFIEAKLHEKLGLTRLQATCALGDFSMIERELESGSGTDINQRVDFDSINWPGDTALHILFKQNQILLKQNHWKKSVQLLLAHGADPTLKNANNDTFFHLCAKYDKQEAISILSNKFTNVNPINNEGLSHFHISCATNNLLVIKEFLKSGVNVNNPVDNFAETYAGFTPLHFAITNSTKEVIELLLNYGADSNLIAVNGLTPFFLGLSSYKTNLNQIEILIRCTAISIDTINTALEMVLQQYNINEEKLNLLLNHGASMNFMRVVDVKRENSSLIFNAASELSRENFYRLINIIPDLTDTDDKDQNIIHYLILGIRNSKQLFSENMCNNIQQLIQKGCEINHKDIEGKTALHKAFDLNYPEAVKMLLLLGGDINVKDNEGFTPYAYISEESCRNFQEEILKHYMYLEDVELFIDQSNKTIFIDQSTRISLHNSIYSEIRSNIDEIKKVLNVQFEKEIGPSFLSHNFFTEKFTTDYRRMSVFKRRAICHICHSDDLWKQNRYLQSLIRLQFQKAWIRTRLIEPAMVAFLKIVDFAFPQLCLESIFLYFSNDDLMNLIRITNKKLIYAPLPEN